VSRPASLVRLVLALAVLSSPAMAQRYDDVEGADACRPIWREFGRMMSGDPRAVFCEVREVGTMPQAQSLSIDGQSRTAIRIEGADRRDVRVRLVIQAQAGSVDEARELAKQVSIDLSERPLRVRGVERESGRSWNRRFVGVTIALETPRTTNVSASVDYAPLDVENVSGTLDLRASHGPLNMRDVGGDVRARVEYGPISVHLSQPKWQGTQLDAIAEYGPVTLHVPRNFGAELEIGARHGPLDVDFPVTLTKFDGSTITTRLGAGGPRVRAIAEYGPMSLKINDDR